MARYDYLNDLEIQQIQSMIKNIANANKSITVFLQPPKLSSDYSDNNAILKKISGETVTLGIQDIDTKYKIQNNKIKESLINHNQIKTIELSQFFYKDESLLFTDSEGKPLFYDEDHLNAHGAEWLAFHFIHSIQHYNRLGII